MEQTPTLEGDISTQQRILAATAEVLGRNGKRKLSLSDVAVQAGVSRPTLYRWFASKEDLLSAFSKYERQTFESGMGRATAHLDLQMQAAIVGVDNRVRKAGAERQIRLRQAFRQQQGWADLAADLLVIGQVQFDGALQ